MTAMDRLRRFLGQAPKAAKTGDKYYAWEKFGSAVRDLATGDLPWSTRLHDAYLHIHTLDEGDMPESVREEYRELIALMTRAPNLDGRGTVIATLALVTDQEARAIAGRFCDVEGALAMAIIDAQREGEHWGEHH